MRAMSGEWLNDESPKHFCCQGVSSLCDSEATHRFWQIYLTDRFSLAMHEDLKIAPRSGDQVPTDDHHRLSTMPTEKRQGVVNGDAWILNGISGEDADIVHRRWTHEMVKSRASPSASSDLSAVSIRGSSARRRPAPTTCGRCR